MKTAIQIEPNISLIKSLKGYKTSVILQRWYTIKASFKKRFVIVNSTDIKISFSDDSRDVLSG